MSRKILVTSALPYANGSIHIGHLVEYIQTDIWARFQKMYGNNCIYCCADDTHGTPIMLRARQLGITPEKLIADMQIEHERDFAGFSVEFDSYYSTHTPENRQCSETIFNRLRQAGHITTREVEQAYCEHCQMFLPDRFIRGTCPKCGAPDQYGDSCEVCHATYTTLELKDAHCSVCGQEPKHRSSKHYFFQLQNFSSQLQQWINSGHVHEQIKNKLQEWFQQGLKDWDISRDAPYFGFLIPGESEKYFYVWLDAPIGYMASTINYCKHHGGSFEDYWCNEQTEIHHFIGKDITYFHALFWPAMLMGAGYNTPTSLTIHGFLTVNGEKMSKSRGTFIKAATYLKHLDPQYLRYYYACKLGPDTNDIDLNTDDFVARVNSDLVGNFANLASRSVPMLTKHLQSKTGQLSEEALQLLAQLQNEADNIAELYEQRHFATAIRKINTMADKVNRYFDTRKPWQTIKTNTEHARETLSTVINAVRLLTIYLKPVLPVFAADIESILNVPSLKWEDTKTLLNNHTVNNFKRLIERVDPVKVKKMIEQSKEEQNQAQTQQSKQSQQVHSPQQGQQDQQQTTTDQLSPLEQEPIEEQITIDDFAKIDLRVAEVVKAELVEGANKLLHLELDLGGQTKNVFAGIRKAYTPEQLLGKKVIMVANLAPRKMRFGISEGMILAAGPGGKEVFMLTVDQGAKPGQRIH